MNRTVEFILGLFGGILGLFMALSFIIIGGLFSGFAMLVIVVGLAGVVFSVLGIVGSIVVKSKPKKGGILMLISAVGGSICFILLYVLPGLLLLIAGLMGIIRKEKTEKAVPQ